MRWLWKVLWMFVCVLAPTSAAFAHHALPDSSGFLHIVAGADHFAGFFIMGALGGLYAHLFGGWRYICGTMLAFVLLASHSHMPLWTGTGLLFAMGFSSAGLLIAVAAARLTIALVEKLGFRRPRAEQD